jgi:UDP-glucose 4-epimerase
MPEIANSKILITGGAGFIGSFVVEHLLQEKVGSIVVLDNFVRGKKENLQKALSSGRVQIVEGDIRDRSALGKACEGVDYCFHFAALRISHCAEKPREALEVMYEGTYNVLEACVEKRIKRIILASTASVYGQADTFPTSESHHPYNNGTLYGAAKMADELMLQSFCQMHQLPFNILRFFNAYGPRMDAYGKYTEVLIRWFQALQEGKTPLIHGDGKQTMDFVYVEDIARASVLVLKSDVVNEVFNIASGRETSLEGLCLLAIDAVKAQAKPQYIDLPKERQKIEVLRRLADISKAKEKLGFETSVDLKQGLVALAQWLDKNRPGQPL